MQCLKNDILNSKQTEILFSLFTMRRFVREEVVDGFMENDLCYHKWFYRLFYPLL